MIRCHTNNKEIKMDKKHEEYFKDKRIIRVGSSLYFTDENKVKRSVKNYVLGFYKTESYEYVKHLNGDTYDVRRGNLEMGIKGQHSMGSKKCS